MAQTNTPLVWDFYREVPSATSLGTCLEYYTGDAQSIYGGPFLYTRLSFVEDGHWADAELGSQKTITYMGPSVSAWDHALTGQLYGVGILDNDLIVYRYLYARELTEVLKDGSWRSKDDSRITQVSLTLKNMGAGLVQESGSMFQPGARISVAVTMGDSRQYAVGVAFLDELDYDAHSPTFTLSGRNTVGYRLSKQTFDDETAFVGNGHEVVEWILERAGVTRYSIGPSEGEVEWSFEPSQTFLDGLLKVFEFYIGWDMIETPDGTVVVGYPAWLQQYMANSTFAFRADEGLVKRKTRKQVDAAYSNVYVTGKDASGADLIPVYRPVQTFAHWALGANKTKHVKASDGMTQEELTAYANQLAKDLAKIGVTESFTAPLRPWLMVGDVASYTDEYGELRRLGLVTSITHRFGESGFFTDFSVDSGGDTETTRAVDVVTRTAAVRGYNRRQDLADLIGVIAKERS